MIHFILTDENYSWLAPYGYAIVFLGLLIFLFRVFESGYASIFNRPLFRHYFVYRKLSEEQLKILESQYDFYDSLSKKHKRQFQHRVATFLSEKKFIGREDLKITESMRVLIAATGCMLSFGRKNYEYGLIEHILIYPSKFYSKINDAYHKGEFNPKIRTLVMSWEDFEKGFRIADDNRNLGIHEFMHAMQLEAKQSKDLDSSRLIKYFNKILQRLSVPEVKEKLNNTNYFRKYGFSNQYEFLAVIAEYFFESPKEFKEIFPTIYGHTQKLLNFRFSGY
jgi:Mlc titration factor MtfA (ptsG expression regulator)